MLIKEMLKMLLAVGFAGGLVYVLSRIFTGLQGGASQKNDERVEPEVLPSPITRIEKLRYGHFLRGRGLEISPGCNPIAPKHAGFDVEIVDHPVLEDPQSTPQETKSQNDVTVQTPRAIDYLWNGGSLSKCVGRKEYYNWIVGSHVLEHTPDLVGFLQSCIKMLKEGGVLSFAIADHRRAKKMCRPLTTPGQVILAHEEKRTRHTLGTLWDHAALACQKNTTQNASENASENRAAKVLENTSILQTVSAQEDTQASTDQEKNLWTVTGDAEAGRAQLCKAQASSAYIDAKAWSFTPQTFKLILHDVCALGWLGCTLQYFFEDASGDFIVHLKKVSVAESFACDRKKIAEKVLVQMQSSEVQSTKENTAAAKGKATVWGASSVQTKQKQAHEKQAHEKQAA